MRSAAISSPTRLLRLTSSSSQRQWGSSLRAKRGNLHLRREGIPSFVLSPDKSGLAMTEGGGSTRREGILSFTIGMRIIQPPLSKISCILPCHLFPTKSGLTFALRISVLFNDSGLRPYGDSPRYSDGITHLSLGIFNYIDKRNLAAIIIDGYI